MADKRDFHTALVSEEDLRRDKHNLVPLISHLSSHSQQTCDEQLLYLSTAAVASLEDQLSGEREPLLVNVIMKTFPSSPPPPPPPPPPDHLFCFCRISCTSDNFGKSLREKGFES